MKIVADNLADSHRRPGAAGTPDNALVDAIGDALRARYGDEAADLPDVLLALACQLDGPASPDGETD
ncbi:hypothetical protein Q8W71_26540 [Methylobacterium sp. NEAU 140]|uniref:hypothetical protein n=1 Tax=Methylobacterium sp. NEAU 140 TaxID=3064945 RepID=UPI00273703ED|nr:hypothetical protein [Methylobacterium sp. NEAU 140]MDP4026189.1 hypothetical protein [Methylobacterium sp. NEAU 140]